ncbi:hypothetical protein [Chryseobacterium shandongense]|uniref:XRE family transcriptional regulator n=1 Tax=Chryseobacterium shandongense TaxID=1493872 RepID=A0ABN5S054_9FLAO|nr:hypothetical protein [Chryseobacterium shandongense]AZA95336.1 hypothetical protein EG353_07075 [Chryseobacterium shandongense]
MQINEKLIELSKELPRGSVKVLSEETGLRQNTIIDIFKGRSKPGLKNLKLLVPAVLKIIEEQKEFKRMLGIEE